MGKKSFFRFIVELVVVITGVTIAFWLNTKAEQKKEQKNLENYYQELVSDLEEDRKLLERIIDKNTNKRNEMVKAISLYSEPVPSRDSIFAYSQLMGNYNFFDPTDITYQSMINSGDLKLMDNIILKRKLISLYDLYEIIDYLQKNHLQALDENFFPKYVYMVDYITGEVLQPIEKDILVKNYFGFMASELSAHLNYYKSAVELNLQLDSLISSEF